MREMTGGCLCGQVRYSANADPAIVAVCHCKNCQKQTGTAFSVLVGVPKSAISPAHQLLLVSGPAPEADGRRYLKIPLNAFL